MIDRLATAGFRAVQLDAAQSGLRPRELGPSARRDLQSVLRRRELVVAGIDLWIPPEEFANTARVDRAMAALFAAIELAGELDRATVSLTVPEDEGMVEALRSAADSAGVRLADFSRSPQVETVIGPGLDPATELAAGEDPAAVALAQSEHLAAVRLVDSLTTGLRGPIGTAAGRLDVIGFRAALDIAGWSKPLTVDLRGWNDPWGGLVRTVQQWAEVAQ